MAETTSRGYKNYSLPTDDNVIFEQYLNDTGNANVELMNTDLNTLEETIDNKIALNGEVGKSNFNFIENKVASGTDYYVKNLNKSISTGIIESDYFSFSGVVSLNENRSTTTYIVGNHTSTANSMSGFTVGVASPSNVVSLFVTLSQNERFVINDIGLRMVIGDNRLSITRDGTTFTIIINGNRYVYTAPTYVKGTKSIIIGDFSTTGKDLECRITGFTTFKQLSQQEITHNLSVINNSQSVNQLQVTDSANKSSILTLGSTEDTVEMASGRTLREEYVGVLEGMSQEYTSTGGAITVNDGLNARLVGAEIQGQTVKNYVYKNNIYTISENSRFAYIKNILCKINQNTKYHVKLRVSNFSNGTGNVFLRIQGTNSDGSVFNAPLVNDISKDGVYRGSFTTSATLEDISDIFTIDSKKSTFKISEIMIIEDGVVVNDNAYFAGLGSTEATITNNGIKYSFYEQFVDGLTVVQKRKKGTQDEWVTIPSNETRDAVANEYRLYSASGLGSVPSVTDKIDCASKKKVDNTEEVLLNSSYTISQNTGATKTNTLYFVVTPSKPLAINTLPLMNIFCSNANIWSDDSEGCKVGGTGLIEIRVLKSKLTTQDVNGFKAWLQSNPITVRYQLATPTETQLTDAQLATYSPYKKQILLGGVGGVNDKLSMNSDGSLSVESKTKEVVFNDLSMSYVISVSSGNTSLFLFDLSDAINSELATSVLSSIFTSYTPRDLYNGDFEGIAIRSQFVGSARGVFIRILKSKLSTQDVNGLKAWLAQNPVTVRYQLATPTTTTIPKEVNAPVLTDKSNILQAGEAVLPSSFSVKIPTTSQIKKQYAQTLLNNYTGTASANLLKDGRVQLDMTVTIPTTFNQTVFSLPTELRPKVARKVMGFNGNNPVTLLVGTDGTVKIPTAITGTVELCDEYDL